MVDVPTGGATSEQNPNDVQLQLFLFNYSFFTFRLASSPKFRSSGPPPFYSLIDLLHKEANRLPIQIRLVSEKRLKKRQNKQYLSVQRKIFDLWCNYEEQTISTSRLLKDLYGVYIPSGLWLIDYHVCAFSSAKVNESNDPLVRRSVPLKCEVLWQFLLKTTWEQRKMLVTSITSFSSNISSVSVRPKYCFFECYCLT